MLGRVVLKGISPLITTLATSFIGALLLLCAALLVDGFSAWTTFFSASDGVQFSLFALGFGGTALAYLWYFAGIQNLGVGTASSYLVLVPVFGIVIAAVWLHEPIDASLLIGGAFAIGGMLLMNRARR